LRAAAARIEPFGVSEGKTTRVGYGAAVASREFRAIFAGQLVSVGGTSVAAVALTIVVFRRTDSPLLASLTFALGFLPYLLGGGLLSSLVDRVRPRGLVVASDTASAVLGALMAWPAIPVPILFALLLAIGTLSSLSVGARAALVRSSVSDHAYVPARSLMRIAAQFAQIGGNACGGVLLILLTTSGALLVNAASFAFSAAVVRLVVADYPNAGERSQATLLRDSLHGARSVFGHAELRRLLLVGWLAPMCGIAPEALAAPYVAHHHGPSAQVGWWLVALPLGTIAGDIFGVRLLTAHQQRLLVAPAAVASFVPYLAFVLDPRFPIAVGLLVTSGACGLYSLGLDARVRDAAPARLFARAMTLNSAGLMTLQGVGFTLAGALAQGVGASTAIAIAGGCGIVSTVVLLRPDRQSTASHAHEAPPAEAQVGSG
jgi:MFS family permease